ncbi:hypothetical protein C6497_06885 [Candidatus Poribacteria bacterium]|nr:MAG: hypothetical protein C6497_06885 [Candidatus Poribacteria bacterium]
MKYNLHGSLIVYFSLILFTIVAVNFTHAALIDLDTVEVLYLFDEGKGEVAVDNSPNGRDGAITGAKYTEGVFGTGLEYDGVDDNLVVTGYAGIGGAEPRTVLFWFKSSGTRDHSLVKWGTNTTSKKYYVRTHPSGDKCFLRIEVSGGQNYGNDDICDGEWHHCALVFPDGADSVKDHDLYVDGVLQDKVGNDVAMDTDGDIQEINIGARLTGHKFLFGYLDELAIFSTDLDVDQINALREDGLQTAASVDPQAKLATSWARIKRY